MSLTHKELPVIDVTDLKNGVAQLLIGQGVIEVEIRLDADQVDDLQAALEAVSQSMEEFHRAKERDEYGIAEGEWRQ